MSLVAYAASSDEESENEDEAQAQPITRNINNTKPAETTIAQQAVATTTGHISDEDDDFVPQEVSLQELKPATGRLTLSLPKPKATVEVAPEPEHDEQVTKAFAKLPMPRAATAGRVIVEELDDEFLHKKELPAAALEKPPAPAVKGRVKITIPSLRDFSDVDKEKADKAKNKPLPVKSNKGCGLLSILPQAKSERNFAKKPETATINSTNVSSSPSTSAASKPTPAFVPDSVKQRRAAHNTECVDGVKGQATKAKKAVKPLVSVSDSDDDEDDSGDFFSLHSKQKLPEVSSNEISALVAKRAAKMVEASNKFLAEASEREAAEAEAIQMQEDEIRQAQKRYHDQQLNSEAMDALVGKNAKRRRKEAQEMQVIDISGTQVMPDREEWMRTALASTTAYQATGVLTDEEPVAGTRRKHQITYLAHKAKANEAELQAMWSANRQTRRATQSKYGF
ncbi:CG17249 [Drosophila busckii]|uniref:CG17249 n=1 Tax=Drosophila busckii TaxID=30019 RepID=A0A0M4EDN8_DROBS|nr:proline-rich protein PRCC [Drosophila busckii]ALC43746.1 CG17249 [Drosophila busckii]